MKLEYHYNQGGMMEKGYLMGIDIGTYESKGVLVRMDGSVAASAVQTHDLLIPRQGWAEHDAEKTWWGDFVTLTRSLISRCQINPNEISGIGISAIAPCMLPVDKDGNPLRMGILYGVDTRAYEEIGELNERFGKEILFSKTGNELSSQAVGPKILWLKKNEPEIYKKAEKFVTASTFIIARLSGRTVIDHLTATFFTPLYDFYKGCWSNEFCDGIVETERLPEIGWASEIAGKVSTDAARITGLAEGTPVSFGTADASAEAVSVGVVKPGQMMLMYGSTIFMYLVTSQPRVDERLWAARYLFPGTSAFAAGMATSGSLTRWFRDKLALDLIKVEESGGENAYAALVGEASKIPAGSEGLIVLPYFSGERTPINDPKARGMFFGLTLAHQRGHLFRAILEGMGYGIRQHFDVMREIGVQPNDVIAVGGGTKNPLWLQVVSDISGMPQKVPAVTFGASYGDAFLAGMAIGAFPSYNQINTWLRYDHIIQPDKSKFEHYDKYYKVYLDLYQRNKDFMARLHSFV
jgi:xylulokinase